MKLSAILSVATLLPLILAIATPQVDDQCDSKCQPVENELNRCKALTPVEVPNCVCKSSVINSNLDAYVTLSSLFYLFFIVVSDSNYSAHVAVVPNVRTRRRIIWRKNTKKYATRPVSISPAHLQRQG